MKHSSIHSTKVDGVGKIVYEQIQDQSLGQEYPGDLYQVVLGKVDEDSILADEEALQSLDKNQEFEVKEALESPNGEGGHGPVEFDYENDFL